VRSYSGCPAARLWRGLAAATFSFALALSVGGCSFSYQLDNLFGKKDDGSLTGALQPAGPAIKAVADRRRRQISSSRGRRSARS